MSLATPTPARSRVRRFTAGAAALTVAGLLVLSGCSSDTSSAAGTQPSSRAGQGGGFGGNADRTVGLIADVSGKTLQVQSTDAQTAVTYTTKTTFTTQVTQPLSGVKVGSCVVAQSAEAAVAGSTTVTASTIAVSAAENGTCTGGFGGQGRTRPSGAPSGMPSGRPSGMPSGAAGRGQAVVGKVTAASGSTLTVEATMGSSSPQSYTVETTGTTKVTAQKSTTAKAAKVGACATVTGKPDSTGAVTATAIAIRPATNGTCGFGTGGRGNG